MKYNKKILCIGNNTSDTDNRTSNLAEIAGTINYGLIDRPDYEPLLPGYYHTTVIDLPEGEIYKLAEKFDLIIMLDQPQDEWSHQKLLLITFKLMQNLERSGKSVVYRNNKNIQSISQLKEEIKDNKSFCIHPWITYYEIDGYTKLCPRSHLKIIKSENLVDWKSAQEYNVVRKKMLAGEMLDDHCSVCYTYEKHGIESYRQYETQEWLSKLKIQHLDDLNNIDHPYFYDLKLSNKCNIMCRSCDPHSSHLIDRESKKHSIIYFNKKTTYATIDCVDIPNLTKDSRVYCMGGETTILPEVYKFMRECIRHNKTDFEFCIGTNGYVFSDTFIDLCSYFSNMHFSISLDGYGKINNYWRHGSNWDEIVKNMHLVKSHGHTISSNTVPGIYNVTNLHLLFEFLDREFPGISMYMQLNHYGHQSAFNHPNSALVVESMERCMNTNVYRADGKSTKSGIDSLHKHYSNSPQCDLTLLKKFFEFNDKLDQIRNISLRDYIPELEACRNLLKNQ